MTSKVCDADTKVFHNKMDIHTKTLIKPKDKQVNKPTNTMTDQIAKFKCLRDNAKKLKKQKKKLKKVKNKKKAKNKNKSIKKTKKTKEIKKYSKDKKEKKR